MVMKLMSFLSRPGLVAVGALALTLGSAMVFARQAPERTSITIYKTPTCGCCGKWVSHMQANGFDTTVVDVQDTSPMRAKAGVPPGLGSCHTAFVGGYAVEGHAPADIVHKMLKEKPAIAGIAVPGMPMGSPGMEGPSSQSYNIVAFDKQGKTTVFASR